MIDDWVKLGATSKEVKNALVVLRKLEDPAKFEFNCMGSYVRSGGIVSVTFDTLLLGDKSVIAPIYDRRLTCYTSEPLGGQTNRGGIVYNIRPEDKLATIPKEYLLRGSKWVYLYNR